MKSKFLIPALLILGALFFGVQTASAKKVKVTIDGTVSPSQTRLFLIINEDTANAMRVPIQDGRFSVTVKVEKDAFIRLSDYKQWPERSAFVLIPDSKHITVDWRTGRIEGSPMSLELAAALDAIRHEDPYGFHIDIFTDDPEARAQAAEQQRMIYQEMEARHRAIILETIDKNSANNIPAWVYFCYHSKLDLPFRFFAEGAAPKWTKHAVLARFK